MTPGFLGRLLCFCPGGTADSAEVLRLSFESRRGKESSLMTLHQSCCFSPRLQVPRFRARGDLLSSPESESGWRTANSSPALKSQAAPGRKVWFFGNALKGILNDIQGWVRLLLSSSVLVCQAKPLTVGRPTGSTQCVFALAGAAKVAAGHGAGLQRHHPPV